MTGIKFLSISLMVSLLSSSCAERGEDAETAASDGNKKASGRQPATGQGVPAEFKGKTPEILIARGDEGVNPLTLARDTIVLVWTAAGWAAMSAAQAVSDGWDRVWPRDKARSGSFGSPGHEQGGTRREEAKRQRAEERADSRDKGPLWKLKCDVHWKTGSGIWRLGRKDVILRTYKILEPCEFDKRNYEGLVEKTGGDAGGKYVDCDCVPAPALGL